MMFYPGMYWIQLGPQNNFDVALRQGLVSLDDKYGIHETEKGRWSLVDLQSGRTILTTDDGRVARIYVDNYGQEIENFRTTADYSRMVNSFKQRVNAKR